jgi:acyl carrier protein
MSDLKLDLKEMIIETSNLDDVEPEEIGDDQALFVEGLGLDSIDALELTVALELAYGVSITDSDTAKAAFASINTLADYVTQHRVK